MDSPIKIGKIILYPNILKMFHILLCPMSDLSWKFRECTFLSNAAKEQMNGQMHGQADEDEEKDRLTENEILPSIFGGSNYWYWSFLHWNMVFWDLPIFGIDLYSAGSPEKLDALLLLHFHPYLSWAVFIKCCDVIRAALCWLCLVRVYWGHELSIIVKLSLWNMPMVRLIFFSFCFIYHIMDHRLTGSGTIASTQVMVYHWWIPCETLVHTSSR